MSAASAATLHSQLRRRPNILLVLARLGLERRGCYGGEIATRNLDGLAARGVRFAQFYNGFLPYVGGEVLCWAISLTQNSVKRQKDSAGLA